MAPGQRHGTTEPRHRPADRLDYFGTTVNIAARAGHEAGGGEVVLTQEAAAEFGVRELLSAASITPLPCEVALRGISEPVPLLRISALPS